MYDVSKGKAYQPGGSYHILYVGSLHEILIWRGPEFFIVLVLKAQGLLVRDASRSIAHTTQEK